MLVKHASSVDARCFVIDQLITSTGNVLQLPVIQCFVIL